VPDWFSVTDCALHGQIFVGPQEALAKGGCVAHERSHRGVILLAVFQPTDDGTVKTRPPCHGSNAQTALLAIALQSLERPLNIKIHPHGHYGVGVAGADTDQVFQRWPFLLQLFAKGPLTGSLRNRLLVRAENASGFHLFLRFF
jgi:hypothetical protein